MNAKDENDKPFTEKDLTNLVRGFGMPTGESLERKVKESISQEKTQDKTKELNEEISPIDSLKSQFEQDSVKKKRKRER